MSPPLREPYGQSRSRPHNSHKLPDVCFSKGRAATMFDLAAVQAALREQQLDGWLLYDFRGLNVLARRVARHSDRRHAVAALVLLRPGPGRAAEARPPHRAARARHLPGSQAGRICAGRNWRPASPQLVARGEAGGDGVRAAQRQPVRLARRCRHGRTGAVLRRRGRPVRRPDAALRGVLGRRAVGHAPGGGQAHAARPTTWRWASSPTACAAAAPSRETEVQQVILDHFAEHKLVTDHPPIVGVGPHSGDPHYAPRPATDAPIRAGRFRADRPVGQARQAAGGLQRPDAGRRSSARTCRRSTRRSSTIVAAARDAAIARVRDAFAARRAAARLAGRSRRPAT